MMPTEEVLEELFTLIQSEQIKSCQMTENVARMSLATLLHKACLTKDRQMAYPTWVLGEFCTPESPIITEKFLPYLLRQMEQTQSWEKKNEIIVTLGMLPRQEVVAKMIPRSKAVSKAKKCLTCPGCLLCGLWLPSARRSNPKLSSPSSTPSSATPLRSPK